MKAVIDYASGGKRYSVSNGYEKLPSIPDIENVTFEDLINLDKDTGSYGLVLNFDKTGQEVHITIYDDYLE